MVTLQPLDKNRCIVPYLKDLFHICLDLEAQDHGITFKVCNLGSKLPHLHSAYVVTIPSQSHTTVSPIEIGYFESSLHTFKVLQKPWALVSKEI